MTKKEMLTELIQYDNWDGSKNLNYLMSRYSLDEVKDMYQAMLDDEDKRYDAPPQKPTDNQDFFDMRDFFEIIDTNAYAVKTNGYKINARKELHVSPTYEKMHHENKVQDAIDAFYDLDGAYLCKGNDGNMYAVEYFFADPDNSVLKPIIWQEVLRVNTKIKAMRLDRNMTQASLAQAADIAERTLQSWENGLRVPTDAYILRRVAQALNCSIEDLLED